MTSLPAIQKELSVVQEHAESLAIVGQESLVTATEYLSRLNRYLDTLNEEKKALTDPLRATVKEINARYAPAEEAVTAAKAVVVGKLSAYQHALLVAQRAAEEKIAAQVESGYLKKDTTIAKKMEAVPEAAKSATAESGSVTFIEQADFEVTSLAELPLEYHLADEVAIRKAMKAGTHLPGVRYFTKQVVRNIR